METFKTELAEKVDGYLDYVVTEWMKENELAIERGLKGEIAEDFIGGLKALFEEHYIDVPDEKYDILESQAQKIDELEEKLNDTIGKLTEKKQSEDLRGESVIKEVSSDLAETQLRSLQVWWKMLSSQIRKLLLKNLTHSRKITFQNLFLETLTEENEETKEIDVGAFAYMSAIKDMPYAMKDAQPLRKMSKIK